MSRGAEVGKQRREEVRGTMTVDDNGIHCGLGCRSDSPFR